MGLLIMVVVLNSLLSRLIIYKMPKTNKHIKFPVPHSNTNLTATSYWVIIKIVSNQLQRLHEFLTQLSPSAEWCTVSRWNGLVVPVPHFTDIHNIHVSQWQLFTLMPTCDPSNKRTHKAAHSAQRAMNGWWTHELSWPHPQSPHCLVECLARFLRTWD